jgi:hypothetical protein
MTRARPSAPKSLAIPPILEVAMLGVMAFGCSGGGSPDSRDASFDGGPCQIQVPDGDVCFTTCIAEAVMTGTNNTPEACQTYCDPGTRLCYFEGGVQNFDCDFSGAPDGAGEVLC